MSLVELTATRTRARRVQRVEFPTQQHRRRSPTKNYRADLEPRRAGLEQGDGISQFVSAEGQDKLKEALRRSASAISTPHTSGSGSSRMAADQHQAAVSPIRVRRNIAVTESTKPVRATRDTDPPFKVEAKTSAYSPKIDASTFSGPSKDPTLSQRVTAKRAPAAQTQTGLTLPAPFATSPRKATSSTIKSGSRPVDESSSPAPSSSPARRPPMATRTSDERLAEIRARLSRATEDTAEVRQLRDRSDSEMARRRTRRALLDEEESTLNAGPASRQDREERSRIDDSSDSARRAPAAVRKSSKEPVHKHEIVEASRTPPRTRRSDRDSDLDRQTPNSSPLPSTSLRSRTRPVMSRFSSDEGESSDITDQRLHVKRPSLQHRKSSEDGARRPFSAINALDNSSPRRRRDEKEVQVEQPAESSPQRAAKELSPALASLEASLARLGARRANQQAREEEPMLRDRDRFSEGQEASESDLHLTVDTPNESVKLRTSIGRHQGRLLDSEKGADQAGNSPRKEIPSSLPLASPSSKPGMTFLERARAARARAQTSAAETLAKQEAEEAAARAREKQEAKQADLERALEEEAEQRRLRALRKISRRKTLQSVRDSLSVGLSEDEEDEARVEREITPMSERESSPEVGDNREALARVARAERNALRLQRGKSMYSLGSSPRFPEHAGGCEEPMNGADGSEDARRTAASASSSLRRRVSAGGVRISSITRLESLAPPSEGILKGVVVLVDVRDLDGNDASSTWTKLLKANGAKLASRVPSADSRRTLTHIVWRNGTPSTLRYFNGLEAGKRPLIVGPAWVDECLQNSCRVAEAAYLVEVGKSVLWQQRRAPRSKKEAAHRPTTIAGDSSVLDKNIQDALQAILAHAPLEPSPLRTALYLKL